MYLRSILTCICCITALLGATTAEANSSQEALIEQLLKTQAEQAEMIKQLQQQLETIQQGQSQIKEEQATIKEEQTSLADNASAFQKAADWAKRVKLHGDLRYRHEYFNVESTKDRNRHRVRARMGLTAKLTDTVDLGFQIATGSMDPVSTNQTLTGAFSSKAVWVDLAYFDWHPTGAPGLKVLGGKFKHPFYAPAKTELLWDGDLRPEGIALQYKKDCERGSFFLNAGGFWIAERGSSSDTYMLAAQVGGSVKFAETAKFTGGLGIYDYDDIENRTPIIGSSFFGNRTRFMNIADPTSPLVYAEKFTEVEAFSEFGFRIREVPVKVIGNYVKNVNADTDLDIGWLAGFELGSSDPGHWKLKYNYRNLERDAVFGIFTDSDFIGGGTDGKGHEIGLGYQVNKRIGVGATYFDNEAMMSTRDPIDFKRPMLDVKFKF